MQLTKSMLMVKRFFQIAKIEGTGVENANDLRDQRDKALDELSEYIDISY